MKYSPSIKTIIAVVMTAMALLALNLQAQPVITVWNPAANPGLWSSPANWNPGPVPGTNTIVELNTATPCIVDSTAGTATCNRINVANNGGSLGTLIITNGGVLVPVYDYCSVGYSGNGTLDVESNGTATFPSHLWIGFNTGATGTFIMNGGTVTVEGQIGLGFSGGTGFAHINGGTLNLDNWIPGPGATGVSINNSSTMDIAGGSVVINGDQTASVNAYIAAGRITGYAGTGTVVANYNNGFTTITAIRTTTPPGAFPQVIIPSLDTNEIVVASATPQEYGAVGDGVTDDSAAFQDAMDAVNNAGGYGGGVVYVPAGNYAFYTNLTIPQGVTLHGDWTDWTTGSNGLAGTTFKVYSGAGQSNAAPFIFMDSMSSLKDVNIWYPNQNPNNITPYPFSVQISGYCVLKNLVLVNSYQGIEGTADSDAPIHILSTVIGSPLYLGISLDMLADISETEDIRFSPNVWPASLLTNAPAMGGSYATWMRANGTAMRLLRVDGELSMDTTINGYNVGIEANESTNGTVGASFYNGSVSNCATALLAQQMQGQGGLEFTHFTLDSDIAVDRTTTSGDATIGFDHCQIIGRKGTAVYSTGADWHNWMAFQNCTISNTLQLGGPGVFNVVDSSLSGATNCVMSSSATRVAFTGCTFSPVTNLVNHGNATNLLVDARQSISNTLPIVEWTNVLSDYVSRRPARTNLYVVTSAPWGAHGNGSNDDTVAIQSALTAAGTNGGGIVFLPAGKYHLTNTLVVPGGVELRGVHEMRSGDGYWADGKSKASVLEPYGGQGTTNGPVALALEANSGVVGVNFNYETQNTNCLPFPPTIQGRGANVYAIGVVCPNSYNYVDLDTYTCTNHFIYMVDGWVLNTGFRVGNGSSGSIVDCQENPSYWVVNLDTSQPLGNGVTFVYDYAVSNAQMNVLGNCTELMVKTFNIVENTFMHCSAEDGYGPNVTGIGISCDGTIQGYVLDAAAPCSINVVNELWFAVFSVIAPALTNDTVAVISTSDFQGTARFFNSTVFGGPEWDYVIGGGDVGFDLVRMLDHAFNGTSVSGGVLHLVNSGAYITYNGSNDFPPYNVAFGADAGIAGKVSEYLGCYAYNGCTYSNPGTNNPINIWLDYALNGDNVLTLTNQYYESQPVPPALSVQYDSTTQSLDLFWPGNATGFHLYATPQLTPPAAWTLVTNSPVYSNGQWNVILPLGTNSSGFYQLEQ